jgi:hypothetical protein
VTKSGPMAWEDVVVKTFLALKNRPRIFLCMSLLLVSCAAKSAPALITCAAIENLSSHHLHLTPCSPQAASPVQLDKDGNGATSACPADDNVEIVVIVKGQTIYILPDQIHVARTGDGIAAAIDTDLK